MSQPSMSRSGFTEKELARGAINQPSEDVTIRADFQGAIRCRTLVIAGVAVTGDVRADRVFVNGRLNGSVLAKEMTVGPQGEFEGECTVEIYKAAGRSTGVIRARQIVARDGAGFFGEVISDLISAQENVEFAARLAHGKGNFDRADVLERARTRNAVAKAAPKPAPVSDKHEVEVDLFETPMVAPRVVPAVEPQAAVVTEVAPGAQIPSPAEIVPDQVLVAPARVLKMAAREARLSRQAPARPIDDDLPMPFLIANIR